MTTLARRNSSINKIREYALPKISLEDEYEVVHVVQEGWRGRLLLVEHKRTRNEVVLKAIHKESTSKVDFFREFHYNYYLSPHTNILNAYDVAFLSGDYYVFAQEYAPFGDLTSNLCETGLGEVNVKKIASQIVSALEFMHSKELVHMNINMDNILVFNIDFSEVKLCDFGSTRKSGTFLKKKTVWLPYAPPEIVATVQNEGFHVSTKQDVWQLGILIYILLTGALPWQKADATDPHFTEYLAWKKRRTYKTPKRFTNFTTRALRMFKRLLEPKPDKRANVNEVKKYLEDKWLSRPMKRQDSGEVDNQSVCYSTFSIHSSKVEKDRVLHALKEHGIETTVDRVAKRKRIHEWIERSLTNNLMFEEDDENENDENSDLNNTENNWHTAWAVNSEISKEINPLVSINKNSQIHPEKGRIVVQGKLNNLLIQTNNENSYSGLPAHKIDNKQNESHKLTTAGDMSSTPNDTAPSIVITSAPLYLTSQRRSSYQDFKKSQNSINESPVIRYKEMHLVKSPELESPHHSRVNLLKSQSSSYQKLVPKSAISNGLTQDEGNSLLMDRSRLTNSKSQNRSRVSNKSPRPVRSHSDRIASRNQLPPRSKSIARHKDVDYDIKRSQTTPTVDTDNIRPLSRHESDDSLSKSDDSLTSVIPMALNY